MKYNCKEKTTPHCLLQKQHKWAAFHESCPGLASLFSTFSQFTVIHCLFLPTCSVCHFGVKTLPGSGKPAEALATCQIIAAGGARWHAVWVMWYRHQSRLTGIIQTEAPPGSLLLASGLWRNREYSPKTRFTSGRCTNYEVFLNERPSVHHTCDHPSNKLICPRAAAQVHWS